MDKLKLQMDNSVQEIEKKYITEIINGFATTVIGRVYEIVCDCLEIKDYETVPDSEAVGGNGYIICNECHRVHYLQDLRDMQ